MRGLRVLMWAAALLTILFQAAFLVELHSPLAMDSMLWSLFVLSVVCLIVFLYARSALSSLRKWRS
jgi:hypothetical protein